MEFFLVSMEILWLFLWNLFWLPLWNFFDFVIEIFDNFYFLIKFQDPITSAHYLYYGGWGHCNVVRLNSNFTGLLPFIDGTYYKEITPEGYVEGPFMLVRNGNYYFMWSEGGWGGPDYRVAYAMGNNPLGPFVKQGVILEQVKVFQISKISSELCLF